MDNPFLDTGSKVYGDRFVGRQNYVRQLQDGCTTNNWAVRGLPHTGKTSLVWHSIIHKKDKVRSKHTFCPVYMAVDECRTMDEFYRTMATLAYDGVCQILASDQRRALDNLFSVLEKKDFNRGEVKRFFSSGLSKLEISVVIILDRFDYIKELGAEYQDLANIRAIISPNIHILIVSNQSIETIEEKVGREGGSILAQLFPSTTILLKQYDEADMEQYWKRLEPYYSEIGLVLDDEYMRKAAYYAGNDPYLLDVYNLDNYNNALYNPGQKKNGVILTRLYERYRSSIRALQREELLDTAIQAILGPVYDIDDYRLQLLMQVDFLRVVDAREKQEVIGHSMGQIDYVDGNYTAYMAKTDYFTLLFKNDYVGKADFWGEWSATFPQLRMLCEDFLKARWGGNWENQVGVSAVAQMLADRKKDENANITPSPLIEYLMETSISDLIESNWQFFAQVFTPIDRNTFKEKYAYVLKMRNHYAHGNTRFLSDDEKRRANECLKHLGERLTEWFKSGKSFPSSAAAASPAPTPAPIPTPIAKPIATSPTTFKTVETVKTIQVTPTPARPKIDIAEDEYLGKIKVLSHRVQIVEPQPPCDAKYLLIDNKMGFRLGCSIREVDYQEDEWVVCKLKPKAKDNGDVFHYVVDIHPAE